MAPSVSLPHLHAPTHVSSHTEAQLEVQLPVRFDGEVRVEQASQAPFLHTFFEAEKDEPTQLAALKDLDLKVPGIVEPKRERLAPTCTNHTSSTPCHGETTAAVSRCCIAVPKRTSFHTGLLVLDLALVLARTVSSTLITHTAPSSVRWPRSPRRSTILTDSLPDRCDRG